MSTDRTRMLRQVQRVIAITFLANLAVAALKLLWAGKIGSVAMRADGYHSLLDAMGNVVGLVGVSAAHRPADEDHPYGHRKYETLTALAVAFLVLQTALEVMSEAWQRFSAGTVASPTADAVAVMVGTVLVNIGVTTYEARAARRLGSDFLAADAGHTMSDVFVSLGVSASLLLGLAGYPWLDPFVAVFVVGIIGWVGLSLVARSMPVLVDAEALAASRIEPLVLGIEGVESCHKIRSRGRPDDVHVDLHIQVDPTISIQRAHSIAHRVKEKIMAELAQVTDVLIHIEPARRG